MNEIRTLMETIAKINEAELPTSIGHGSGNADVVSAYANDEIPDLTTPRVLQVVGQPGSLKTWYEVMNAALGWNENEYNDFNADTVATTLSHFLDHPSYTFYAGREYSPVLYIGYPNGNRDEQRDALEEFGDFVKENSQELNVSEIHLQDSTKFADVPILRLWWD